MCSPTLLILTCLFFSLYKISPGDFGLEPHPLDEVSGGTAAERVGWFREVLTGKKGAVRDFIVANAASGLYVAGVAPTLAKVRHHQECFYSCGL